MENKKRLIDANALIKTMREEDKKCPGVPWSTTAVSNCIERLDTVDAVEVVRCKECEFSYEGLVNLMCGRCGQTKGNLRLGGVSVKEDHFCGYGKRRDGK